MPVRLVVFLLAVLGGLLYITTQNPQPIPVTLYPGLELSLPLAVILLAAFFIGVVAVMFLYFFDTAAAAFDSLRRSARERRSERVKRLYEAGAERLLVESGREAEKFFKRALAHEPDHVPSLIALGKMRRKEGSVTEAIKLHSKARGLDGKNLFALFELAEDYAAAEQFANAVSILREARLLAGRSLPPLVRIRDIYLKVRNWPGALATQKEIVSLAPWDRAEDERKMLAALTYESALDSLSAGKRDEAIDQFRAALRGDDQFVPAYLKLAETYNRTGSRRDAVKTLEKGFKVTHSIVILMALESLFFSWGEEDKAIAELKWAKNIMPDEDLIRLFLAEAYLRRGDYTEARREINSIGDRLDDVTLFHLVEGKARRGENNIDLALQSMEAAYGREVGTFFHFTCSICGHISSEYSGRCRSCGAWNTLAPLTH